MLEWMFRVNSCFDWGGKKAKLGEKNGISICTRSNENQATSDHFSSKKKNLGTKKSG